MRRRAAGGAIRAPGGLVAREQPDVLQRLSTVVELALVPQRGRSSLAARANSRIPMQQPWSQGWRASL